MNDPHTQDVIKAAAGVIGVAAASVLAERISEHYSETDWKLIATAIVERAAQELSDSLELRRQLEFSDLYTRDGRLNVEGICLALDDLAQRTRKPEHQAQLRHLARYFRNTHETMKNSFRS